ncbi:hypothetical protein FQN54_000604 [Arachnomyces sp. PD_36]|nr:hypothetical protein FQN54_000604 [Arachnomyces sp. PD_36]
MLFGMKSIFLYGILAVTHASPVPAPGLSELSKRAKLGDFDCPDGRVYESDIRAAYHECRQNDDGKVGKYPAYFGNKSGNDKVFSNIPDGTDLREFPIVEGGVYTSGSPGKYRVVTDYKGRGDFKGVMQHTGSTVGGAYTACTRVTDTKREIESTSDSSDDTNELDTRTKKKKVGSATCDDGTTLSKEEVGSAFAECKKNDDYAVGGSYPHAFGNKSGGGNVFEGVSKDLREFPIIQGGTWSGGSSPGAYRVVTDYNNKFVGVMIEKAGGSFTRCTVNDD